MHNRIAGVNLAQVQSLRLDQYRLYDKKQPSLIIPNDFLVTPMLSGFLV